MQMTEILGKLKDLQDVLAQKYEIEAKVEELPKALDGNTESLERFKKDYIEKNAEYEEEKQKVVALRAELEEATRLREAGEKGMDEISTHREYEMLDKQISEAQEKETTLRRSLQKEEKILSELNDNLKNSEELIAATEKEVTEVRESLSKEIDGYKQQLTELSASESEMSNGIEPEIIFKFQRIIQRNRKGIVAVKGNVCDGCHMILPAQFANEVHKGEKILFCPYCSRILFYEEADVNAENFFTMDDAGSLADLSDDDAEFSEYDEDEDISDEDSVEEEAKSSIEYDD